MVVVVAAVVLIVVGFFWLLSLLLLLWWWWWLFHLFGDWATGAIPARALVRGFNKDSTCKLVFKGLGCGGADESYANRL